MVDDLDQPARLVARWGLLAAVHMAIGVHDVFSFGPDGGYLDDHGGNWAALDFPGGGRVVFFGYDHEYSQTSYADPPLDLLAGGPPWLPWTRLGELAGRDELGWCYWFDAGCWSRSSEAVDRDLPDGRVAVAGDVLSDERALAALDFTLTGWDRPQPAPAPEIRAAAGAQLLQLAGDAFLDYSTLGEFVELGGACAESDVRRGLSAAGAAGLTPGSPSPLLRPAGPAPDRPPRRRRRTSDDRQADVVWAAMRQATELPRQVPAARRETRKLVGHLRGHGYLRPGDAGISLQACNGSFTSQGPRAIGSDDLWDVARLIDRLRNAEYQPGQGHWIWLHVELDGRETRITRAFDHLPAWWNGEPKGLFLTDLQAEMDARSARWRPAWAELLSPDAVWEWS